MKVSPMKHDGRLLGKILPDRDRLGRAVEMNQARLSYQRTKHDGAYVRAIKPSLTFKNFSVLSQSFQFCKYTCTASSSKFDFISDMFSSIVDC